MVNADTLDFPPPVSWGPFRFLGNTGVQGAGGEVEDLTWGGGNGEPEIGVQFPRGSAR